MESILTSIKKLLGIKEEYEEFDTDIMIYINSVFPVLAQLGIGPKEGFMIFDSEATWVDYLGEDNKIVGTVKTFIYLKTKMLFDPPLSSAVLESYNNILRELEWRLTIMADELVKLPKYEISVDGTVLIISESTVENTTLIADCSTVTNNIIEI